MLGDGAGVDLQDVQAGLLIGQLDVCKEARQLSGCREATPPPPRQKVALLRILRSSRPGRSRAGSRVSGRLVAMIILTLCSVSKPSIWFNSWRTEGHFSQRSALGTRRSAQPAGSGTSAELGAWHQAVSGQAANAHLETRVNFSSCEEL